MKNKLSLLDNFYNNLLNIIIIWETSIPLQWALSIRPYMDLSNKISYKSIGYQCFTEQFILFALTISIFCITNINEQKKNKKLNHIISKTLKPLAVISSVSLFCFQAMLWFI